MTMQDGPPTGGRPATIKNNEVQALIALARAQDGDEPPAEGGLHGL